MIPKIFHHVWIGPNPLPKQEKEWIQSWKDKHPNYEFFLWNNDTIKNLSIPDNCVSAIKHLDGLYACQADIVRYIAVHQFGGIYVDTDIECFKSIDELMSDNLEFIGLRPHGGNWMTNAFFGACKDSQILSSVVSNISPEKNPVRNPYGPTYLTRHVGRYFNYDRSLPIDKLRNERGHVLSPTFWSKKDPYCKHYFKASWLRKEIRNDRNK